MPNNKIEMKKIKTEKPIPFEDKDFLNELDWTKLENRINSRMNFNAQNLITRNQSISWINRISNKPWVDVRNHSSFSAAIDTIVASEKTLLIPNEQTVTDDKTVPSNVTLKFLHGGFLNISAGKTVTINSHVEAGLYQIFKGDGSVSFGSALIKKVHPHWWGFSITATAAVNTAALQAAVTAAYTEIHARYSFDPTPPDNAVVGYSTPIIIPEGMYQINDTITYGPYHKFRSKHGILNQIDSSKYVFYSEDIYQNEFEGIIFVGGLTHIYARNKVTPTVGMESVVVKIRDCDFQHSYSYAIQLLKSGAGGGEQGIIKDSRFRFCNKTLKTEFNFCSLKDVWNSPYGDYMDADTAQIHTSGQLVIDGFCGVPTGLGATPYAGTTKRWIDNYGSVSIKNSRFGGEGGGGIPIVYNFTDALSDAAYPYFEGWRIVIKDSYIYCGSAEQAVIVLKSGLPHQIILKDNLGVVYPSVYIKTTSITGAVSLTTYLTGIGAYEPLFKFIIKNNIGWVDEITSSAGDTALLFSWLEYGFVRRDSSGGNIEEISDLTINSDIFRIRTSKTPASAGAAGNAGDICWDASYIYVCTATNTWERAAIASW